MNMFSFNNIKNRFSLFKRGKNIEKIIRYEKLINLYIFNDLFYFHLKWQNTKKMFI